MSDKKIKSNFTINKIKQLQGEFDHGEVEQLPFLLNTPGPPTIRGKEEGSEPYKAET